VAFEGLDALDRLRKRLEQDNLDLLSDAEELRRLAHVGKGRRDLREGRREDELPQRLPATGIATHPWTWQGQVTCIASTTQPTYSTQSGLAC
jgi:hypothetical protein